MGGRSWSVSVSGLHRMSLRRGWWAGHHCCRSNLEDVQRRFEGWPATLALGTGLGILLGRGLLAEMAGDDEWF